MHYTGMMALEVPDRITWVPNLVVVSVVLGIAFGALSVFFAARRDDWLNTSIAIFLLTFAIVGMHFTAMGAVLIMPDPGASTAQRPFRPPHSSSSLPGVAAIILGICRSFPFDCRSLNATTRHRLACQFLLRRSFLSEKRGARPERAWYRRRGVHCYGTRRQGESVQKGKVAAIVSSQSVTKSIARLTADIAARETRRGELRIRSSVVNGLFALAPNRQNIAGAALKELETLTLHGNLTSNQRTAAVDTEYRSYQDLEDAESREACPQ